MSKPDPGKELSGASSIPHSRQAARRRRRQSDPAVRSRCHYYGPPRRGKPWKERDLNYWRWYFLDFSEDDEKKEEKKKKKKDDKRLPDDQVKQLSALLVKDLNLHILDNAKKHHTAKYDCIKIANGEDAQPVLRRGQEFEATITFNRAYNKAKDDLIFLLDADDENPGKNLKERFKLDEDGTDTYRKDEEWGARILEMDKKTNTIKMAVYIPGNCVVGEWELKVKTTTEGKKGTATEGEKEDLVYEYPQPVIILFNPWSKADQVYMADTALLQEYVLNPSGSVYKGTSCFISSSPWCYGQFDKGILSICLSILRRAFGFKMSPCMGDPVTVSRALTKIVNDAGDQGVLVGNWSGNYDGGKSPGAWTSSTAILRDYQDSGKPVKYGQCWVFSHVLTAVCRALGLPCRSVTNFGSAHDTDNTCTIDYYFDENGEEKNDMNDSIWNFHVWNEVWILRPDLEKMKLGNFDGWHVIDATPQEQSYGVYQCGPCPVKAVKQGQITVGFDTAFVFAEVNADVVHWEVNAEGEAEKVSKRDKERVGKKISTKPPDGKPHTINLSPWMNDKGLRLDLTEEYKCREGTPEEREAVRRAVGYTRHGSKLYSECCDLEVTFDKDTKTMVGQDMVVKAHIKNCTKEDKEVSVLMAARTCNYWNRSQDDKALAKEKREPKTLRPGQVETIQVTVKCCDYMAKCDKANNVYAYVCARDVKANMPYTAQEPFAIGLPDLQFAGPQKAKSGEMVTVKVTFTNPLDVPLSKCGMALEGGLKVGPDDKNPLDNFGWIYVMECGEIPKKKKMEWTFQMFAEDDPDEEEETIRTEKFSFYCDQLDTITGCHSITVVK